MAQYDGYEDVNGIRTVGDRGYDKQPAVSLRTIIGHPFFALAREWKWDDAQLAAARKLIDVTVILVEEFIEQATNKATLPAMPVWKCKSCGCLWRDNLDDTVSLLNAEQKSCAACEESTPHCCEIHWILPAPVIKTEPPHVQTDICANASQALTPTESGSGQTHSVTAARTVIERRTEAAHDADSASVGAVLPITNAGSTEIHQNSGSLACRPSELAEQISRIAIGAVSGRKPECQIEYEIEELIKQCLADASLAAREGVDHCAEHMGEALVLICQLCFESDKTAAATLRGQHRNAVNFAEELEHEREAAEATIATLAKAVIEGCDEFWQTIPEGEIALKVARAALSAPAAGTPAKEDA